MKFATRLDLGIMGKPDSVELCSQIVSKIDIKPNMKFLNVACGHGTEAKLLFKALIASGHYTREQAFNSIYLIDNLKTFTNYVKMIGFKNVITEDFMQWNTHMKFDTVFGNPPYGKNSNLALAFLNKAMDLSDNVVFVVPRTLRKSSSNKKINLHLHLVSDVDAPDNTFDFNILTCVQTWKVDRTKERVIEHTATTHEDFEFVTKEEGEFALGRVGMGPCSKVFMEFANRSPNSHYFLKVKSPAVIEKLISLQSEFRESSGDTVGIPSLSKTEIVRIYSK